MDNQFLMGNGDGIVRSKIESFEATYITPSLRKKLLRLAIEEAYTFYEGFFGEKSPESEYDTLVDQYLVAFDEAVRLGLFQGGGIREKHHILFWCLGRFFQPEVYIESGVFTGSSLHAYLGSPQLKEIVAIDPNLSHLRIPEEIMPEAALIDNMDFSQLQLDLAELSVLAYFDDHINSADRIIQSAEKGIRYILFDDSNGYEGLCQRLYPASPTLPMIMKSELFSEGDEIRWTFRNPKQGNIQCVWKATAIQIESCRKAKSLIKQCSRMPELSEHIPMLAPEKLPDTSKYIVELNT